MANRYLMIFSKSRDLLCKISSEDSHSGEGERVSNQAVNVLTRGDLPNLTIAEPAKSFRIRIPSSDFFRFGRSLCDGEKRKKNSEEGKKSDG